MKILKHRFGVPRKSWLKKSLLIMKLTIILILFFSIQVSANVYSQTKVDLNFQSVYLKKVLSTIEKQSIYRFVYSDRKMVAGEKIDIHVKNEEVITVLDQILANSSSTYRLLANNLIVITSKEKQTSFTKVTGKVIDENGQPLPGASVKLKDSKTGTVTDVNGSFTIEAPDQSVLIISFIGYANREIVVSGTAPLSISMVPTGNNLNEVVVVGYGTQKKVNLTGAIATVTSEKLESRPLVNLGDG